MKNKIIFICSVLVILALGIFYVTNNNLIADDKDGKKDCSSSCTDKTSSSENKSGCTDKNMSGANSTVDPNNEYAVYEFVTDKIHCDGCKTEMTENLMGVTGIKEISYGETCKVSQMTSVKVFYSAQDTTPEVVAASVKEKGLTCDQSKCSDKNKTEKKL